MQFAAILNILTLALPLFLAVSDTSKKVVKGTTGRYILAIAAYFILKKWAVAAAKDKAAAEIQSGSMNANAAATLYRQALNPSGFSWAASSDGTDEDLLFQLAAARTFLYSDAVKSYQVQYDSNLTNDIREELDTEDYAKFIKILNQ